MLKKTEWTRYIQQLQLVTNNQAGFKSEWENLFANFPETQLVKTQDYSTDLGKVNNPVSRPTGWDSRPVGRETRPVGRKSRPAERKSLPAGRKQLPAGRDTLPRDK